MNNTVSDIMNRRSIRKYKPEQISREELDVLSGHGQRSQVPRAKYRRKSRISFGSSEIRCYS